MTNNICVKCNRIQTCGNFTLIGLQGSLLGHCQTKMDYNVLVKIGINMQLRKHHCGSLTEGKQINGRYSFKAGFY